MFFGNRFTGLLFNCMGEPKAHHKFSVTLPLPEPPFLCNGKKNKSMRISTRLG
jgi:hypothetical protein